MKRAALGALVGFVAVLLAAPALGTQNQTQRAFEEGLAALERGAHDDAIDRFELMADRGMSHPDASYNRALAYVARARSSSARPGDLGRAAAALAESVELDPDDAEAEQALVLVRQEIARRRARSGGEPVRARPALWRAVLGVLPESWWAVLAVVGSALLSGGLALRFAVSARRAKLAGNIIAGIGGAVFCVCASAAFFAARMHAAARPAVVVVSEARLLDEAGRPLPAKGRTPGAIPEGESVYVHEQRGSLHRVEWGSIEGFVSAGQLRFLAQQVRIP